MKVKLLILALTLFGGAFAANAQLTTGEPTAKVIRTGNRAKAGDFGLYIGATTSMFGNIFNESVDVVPLPLLNFKYMTSNNFELRVGLEAYKLTEKLKGEKSVDNSVTTSNRKYGTNSLTLYPGFAYHFSNLNILDVYVGAELPIGWDANTLKTNTVLTNDQISDTVTKRAFVLGLGAFVGLQAYIADLPLAIGVEYGISSRVDAGLKYKTVHVQGNTTTTSYSQDINEFVNIKDTSVDYSKLAARRGEIGGQLRVTLSYYFK